MIPLRFPIYSPLLRGSRHAAQLRNGWPKAVSAANLTMDGRGNKIRTPQLSHIEIAAQDGSEITALVDMATVGRTVKDLSARIEQVTASLHAYQIKVERIDPAHARITILFKRPKKPPRYDPLSNALNALDLEQYPINLDPTGDAALLLTKSILIGGESESGKSNLVWYILNQINAAQVPYRLWVIDPAGGVELADLEDSPLTRSYVDRISQIANLVDGFRSSMDTRLSSMKEKRVKRHTPSPQEPLEILIIDEILLARSQLKGGDAASPLGEILASGRKALHIVIACSQLGQKDVIGQIRDLFPQRVCLRTRTQEMTDAVLGTNATTDGANCHRITGKGEGYVFTDQSGVFEKFHAPLVTETRTISFGGTTLEPQPTNQSWWRKW